MGETYAAAGVTSRPATRPCAGIGHVARSTFRPEVLGDIGGFGGRSSPCPSGYRQPVLVSSTDGVGTKLLVAEAAGRFDTIGIDLVAMCVDDVAVPGRRPALLPRLHRRRRGSSRPSSRRSWPAWPRAAARPGARWSAARWPSTATGHAARAGRLRGRAWSSATGILDGRAVAAGRRRASGCRRPGCARTATRWPDGCCSVTSRAGSTTRRGPARHAPWPTSSCCRRSSTRPTMAALRRAVAVHGVRPHHRRGHARQPGPRAARRGATPSSSGGRGRCPASSTRSNGGATWPTTRWRACSTSASACSPSCRARRSGWRRTRLAARGGSYVVGRVVAGERTVTLA